MDEVASAAQEVHGNLRELLRTEQRVEQFLVAAQVQGAVPIVLRLRGLVLRRGHQFAPPDQQRPVPGRDAQHARINGVRVHLAHRQPPLRGPRQRPARHRETHVFRDDERFRRQPVEEVGERPRERQVRVQPHDLFTALIEQGEQDMRLAVPLGRAGQWPVHEGDLREALEPGAERIIGPGTKEGQRHVGTLRAQAQQRQAQAGVLRAIFGHAQGQHLASGFLG